MNYDKELEEIYNFIVEDSARLFPASTKLEAKAKLSSLIQRARKDQSKLTSKWIEKHIDLLRKDKEFRETTGDVALTYAINQARQGRLKALNEPKEEK